MRNRFELARGFLDIAEHMDQAGGDKQPRDLDAAIFVELQSRGLLISRPEDVSTLTGMYYDKMKDAFVGCVKAMQTGAKPFEIFPAFEKVDFCQTQYFAARKSDVGDTTKPAM